MQRRSDGRGARRALRAAVALAAIGLAAPLAPQGARAQTEAPEDGTPPAEAPAHPEPAYDRDGSYLGAAVLYAKEDFDLRSGIDADDSWGLSLWAGQRLHSFVSVEAQFDWLREFQLEAKVPGAPDEKLEIDGYLLTGNVRVFPLSGPFQPYMKAGIGFLRLDGNRGSGKDDAFTGRVGGGLDLYLTPQLVANVAGDYVLPAHDIDDFRYFSLVAGLQYRF